MSPVRTLLSILQPSPPLLEWWYGLVLHPYGHPSHIKHAKHLLYVWSGSGRSMKWMVGCNHILQHVPSENPTQSPSTTQPTTFRVMVWYGAASLWPLLDTFERAETHYICMKWIWYEYEAGWRSQSYPTACPQWETMTKSYDCAHSFLSDGMVWCCGIMTASHGWRLLNTFYRYNDEVHQVWSGS
jgi:hypothetical protein